MVFAALDTDADLYGSAVIGTDVARTMRSLRSAL